MNLNHFTCTLKLNYKNLSYTSYTFIYIFDSSIIDRVIKQEVRWEPFLLRLSCVHQRFLMDSLRRKLSYIYSALVQPKQNKNSSHVTTTIYENIWDIYMYIIYKATKFIHISNCINLWLRNFSNIVMTKVRFFIIFNSDIIVHCNKIKYWVTPWNQIPDFIDYLQSYCIIILYVHSINVNWFKHQKYKCTQIMAKGDMN